MKKKFTAKPVLASSEFDTLLSWVKDALDISDKAAKIIANWYYDEYAIDDFDSKEDFMDFIQEDIYSMVEAADKDSDYSLVVRELKNDGYEFDDAEFSEEEILEMVMLHFEYGQDYDLEDFEGNEDAYNEYFDLLDLGPKRFYEEYKDKINFSERFIDEYGG